MPSQMPAILQAVMKGQSKALADAHYPCWHLAPVTGLMNDQMAFVVWRPLSSVLSMESTGL